jgi:hypothetical protein
METVERTLPPKAIRATPEHVLDEWLAIEVPDTETALAVIEQLEASAARDVRADRTGERIRIRWR